MSAVRQLELAIHEYVEWLEEQGFIAWAEDSLSQYTVNRLIEQIGEMA